MRLPKRFTLRIAITLAIILAFAFTIGSRMSVESNRIDGTVAFIKKIERTDPACLQLYYYIEQYADSFNIPRKYAFGIANVETSYNGPFDWDYNHARTSSAGAVGPMQIMPMTDAFINHCEVTKSSVKRLKTDIEYNVKTSMKLLRWLHDKYGDWKVVFGWYNTGRPVINEYAVRVYRYQPKWYNSDIAQK